jgi:hypothetical protein
MGFHVDVLHRISVQLTEGHTLHAFEPNDMDFGWRAPLLSVLLQISHDSLRDTPQVRRCVTLCRPCIPAETSLENEVVLAASRRKIAHLG